MEDKLAVAKLKLQAAKALTSMDGNDLKLLSILMPKQHIHREASDLDDRELENAILAEAERIKADRQFNGGSGRTEGAASPSERHSLPCTNARTEEAA